MSYVSQCINFLHKHFTVSPRKELRCTLTLSSFFFSLSFSRSIFVSNVLNLFIYFSIKWIFPCYFLLNIWFSFILSLSLSLLLEKVTLFSFYIFFAFLSLVFFHWNKNISFAWKRSMFMLIFFIVVFNRKNRRKIMIKLINRRPKSVLISVEYWSILNKNRLLAVTT